MITDALLGLLAWVVEHTVGLFPTVTLPTWLSGMLAWLTDGLGSIRHFGHFIPLPAIANAAVVVMAVSAVCLAVRVGRMGISHATGGGGVT